jgi:FkbM family methyltransferase
MSLIKSGIKGILKVFDKRITNYNSPAKPFENGMEFIKSIAGDPDWIIDVGVADGTPEILNSFPYQNHKYLLVEANPSFLPYLEKTKENFPDNVYFENCFCGDQESEINFFLDLSGRGSSRYITTGVEKEVLVKVKTLDSLVDKNRISGSVILKLDVEGAEMEVLRGAEKTLKICDFVIMESWINPENQNAPHDFADLVAFMKARSFVVFDFFGGHSYKSGVLKMVDIVFVKEGSVYRQNLK